jgi:pimeloyl-ACP methyl ester carboxylesterase
MAVQTRAPAARAEFAWAARRPAGLPALAAFNGPVLLASGQQDRLCPPPWQQAMHAARPDAQWLELPRVGHFLPLEAPARLSQAMRLWMQR